MPEKALQMWGHGAIARSGGTGLRAALISATFLAIAATRSATGADLPVDLELVLAVDVSGSINTEHAHLQRSGYARALTDHRVVDAIQAGSFGRIALTYVEWADDSMADLAGGSGGAMIQPPIQAFTPPTRPPSSPGWWSR